MTWEKCMNLYYLTAYFLMYAFLGWVVEVVYHVVSVGKIINRGFLNGPLCPIYGFGMIGILAFLKPLSGHPLLLYGGGILFATFVELAGGFILFKIFHLRWWDYSNEPFNLGGYICLRFSIAWGICIVLVLKVIHPVVELNVHILDHLPGHIIIAVLYVIFLADFLITVLSIMNLNKDLKRLNALAAEMRRSSDKLTDRIGNATFDMEVKVQEGRVQAALARAEGRDKLEEIRDRADDLTDHIRDRADDVTDQIREKAEQIGNRILAHHRTHALLGYERLRRAFPNMYHEIYPVELDTVMDTLHTRKNRMDRLFRKKTEKKDEE